MVESLFSPQDMFGKNNCHGLGAHISRLFYARTFLTSCKAPVNARLLIPVSLRTFKSDWEGATLSK